MNSIKNNLDEMQEQTLLKIEHNGMWFAFWGLLSAILIQVAIGNGDKSSIAGEWIVFMLLASYMGISTIRKGIWDRRLKPNLKTNIAVSSISGAVCGITILVSSYLKYHKLLGSIAYGVIIFIFTFALTLIALSVSARLYKKSVEKLENDNE